MTRQESGWDDIAEKQGVRLRATGDGKPLILIPGMEGDGTSCLHVALRVIQELRASIPLRLILVDYAGEQHPTLADLDETILELLRTFIQDQAIVWGQSFGCLPAATVARRLPAECLIMVSPFTRLPRSREVAAGLIRWTPRALYRATSKPICRWVFGPAGTETNHPFFTSLQNAEPQDVTRRARWLQQTNYYERFAAVSVSSGTWFGTRDRLISFREQLENFNHLSTERGFPRLVPDAGHVILPPGCVDVLCMELVAWLSQLWTQNDYPGVLE
jgi:pimeloyl-ACP methyl ester carboxylesterase